MHPAPFIGQAELTIVPGWFLKEEQMKTKLGGIFTLFLTVLIISGFLFTGCGSGGGSGGDGSGSTSGGGGSGSVALLLADNPTDDYASIFLCITKVILISASGNHYVLFESDRPGGYCVDLLKYREKDFLFTVRDDVPEGRYNKIRLEVSKVTGVGKDGPGSVPCEDNIKLPSGKIDLNPRGGFYVKSGKALSIRLDIDANKSFALHEAGKSGKCIFRPVVFVDIEPVYDFKKCPDMLKGQILYVNSNEGVVDYFILGLDGNRRKIKVELSDRTRIFDEDGEFVNRTDDELKVRQFVKVRGWLTPRATLRASLVVIGDVLTISGTADDGIDANTDTFPLLIDPGQELIGNSVDVLVSNETLILAGCDTEVDSDAIQQYVRTEVIGKYDLGGPFLRSVAVLLKSFKEVRGFLGKINEVTGGYELILYDSDEVTDQTPTFEIFLPYGRTVWLLGDGPVPIDLLQDLVECKRWEVIVHFDEDESKNLVAQKVVVINETVRGEVVSEPDENDRILKIEIADGSIVTVKVRKGAFFYKQGDPGDGGDFDVDFGDIGKGDNLNISGLTACDDPSIDFYGFAVVILAPSIIP